MKLLFSKRSPYARKARVVALEKNIPVEFCEEDLTKKTALLLDANPLGKVPVLILDNGRTLLDSPVICEYLDGLNDRPVLIPRENIKRFEVLTLAAVADGVMDTAIALYMEKIRHPADFAKDFVLAQEATFERILSIWNKDTGAFKDLTLGSIAAACALGYVQFRLPALVSVEQFPELLRWFKIFSERPSMQATRPG